MKSHSPLHGSKFTPTYGPNTSSSQIPNYRPVSHVTQANYTNNSSQNIQSKGPMGTSGQQEGQGSQHPQHYANNKSSNGFASFGRFS